MLQCLDHTVSRIFTNQILSFGIWFICDPWSQQKVPDFFSQAIEQYYTSLVLRAKLAKIAHLTLYNVACNNHASRNRMQNYTFSFYFLSSLLSLLHSLSTFSDFPLYASTFSLLLNPASLYVSHLTFSPSFLTLLSYPNFFFHFFSLLFLSNSSTFSLYFHTILCISIVTHSSRFGFCSSLYM